MKDGIRVPVSLETTNEADAIRIVLERRSHPDLIAPDLFPHEITAYLKESLERGRVSLSFTQSRKPVLLRFGKAMGIKDCSKITAAVCYNWMEALRKEKLSPATIEGYVYTLRGFCRWLVKRGKLRENPIAKVELPKITKQVRRDFIPKAEAQVLIKKANGDLKTVLYLGFHCGLRKNEIIEARWEWVDFDRNCLTVQSGDGFRTKDRDFRSIPLTEKLAIYLRKQKKKEGFIVANEVSRGKSRYRWDFRKPFADFMKAQNAKCTAHDMRRSFASNLVIAGVSIFKVAKWLGDRVNVVEDHYAHLVAGDKDIEKLN